MLPGDVKTTHVDTLDRVKITIMIVVEDFNSHFL